jgi:carbamoyl-phosphate synthase large subunit
VYPPQGLTEETQKEILETTHALGKALQVKGLINIQYVLAKGKLYVIEVNPRASRTVPILSKVTGVPMVDLAISTMLGKKLEDLDYGTGLAKEKPLVAVKVPVFSTQKLVGVLPLLSPEMKSTGEVLGLGRTYEEALYKGFLGAGVDFQEPGLIWMAGQDDCLEKQLVESGFELIRGLDEDAVEAGIQNGKLQWMLDLTNGKTGSEKAMSKLRNRVLLHDRLCFSSQDTVEAFLMALKFWQENKELFVTVVQNYRKEVS